MENRTPHQNPPTRTGQQIPQDAQARDDDSDERQPLENESELSGGGDIGFDRVVGADQAGLGGGLDQAEEAQLGVTDEELSDEELAKLTQRPLQPRS